MPGLLLFMGVQNRGLAHYGSEPFN